MKQLIFSFLLLFTVHIAPIMHESVCEQVLKRLKKLQNMIDNDQKVARHVENWKKDYPLFSRNELDIPDFYKTHEKFYFLKGMIRNYIDELDFGDCIVYESIQDGLIGNEDLEYT